MFEVKTIVKLTLSNQYHTYYPEDDWNIEGYGETIQDAVTDVIKSNREKAIEINISSCYVELTKVVDINGERFYSKNKESIKFNVDYSEYGLPNYVPKKLDDSPQYYFSYYFISNFVKDLFGNHPLLAHYTKVQKRLDRFKQYIQLKKDKETELKNKKATYEQLKKELENVD